MSKLKVGLLIDSSRQPAWVCEMIRVIQNSEVAKISQIVHFGSDPVQQPERNSSMVRRFLLAVQKVVVGNAQEIDNALIEEDATELFAGTPSLMVERKSFESADLNCNSEVEQIRAAELDVLIQLCSSISCDEIFRSARHGVWSYDFALGETRRHEPLGYWDVMRSNPVTELALRIRRFSSDTGIVAYRSFSSTDINSIEDNASKCLWKALYFVPRKLEELHNIGEKAFFASMRNNQSSQIENASAEFEELTDRKLAIFLRHKVKEKLLRKWRSVFYQKQWFLMYRRGSIESTSREEFNSIMPPKDRLWADPFIVFRDGRYYIFIEESQFAKGKGVISVMILHEDGTVDYPVPVLEKDHHLSYPSVFEHEKELYMTPEGSSNLGVDLYKCREFPYKWELCANLISGRKIVDPTVFFWDGLWWMFGNSVDNDNASTWDELHIYFSDSLVSNDWIAHPKNPVISDVRCARPAGKLFVRDGNIYRPSQNCSHHYGYGLNIAKVTTLNNTDYEEQVITRLEPDHGNGILSMHTFNHAGGMTVIDAERQFIKRVIFSRSKFDEHWITPKRST